MRSIWWLTACAIFAGAPLAIADSRQDRQHAEQKCVAKDPSCDWLATLSSLERQSVTRAIAKRGYTVEPAPWGKTIAKLHIYNEDVFAEKFGLLEFFNHFHVTTKERAIAVEVVIGAGELWDQDRVNETARRLRDPLWTSVVVVIPVVSADDPQRKVDMLVVTRDIWSLRLNTQYTFQQGSLTNLSVALSENNFLGRRSVFAAGFTMDQGSIATGPIFLDKNLLGRRLDFRARFDFILNRQNLQEELGFADGPPTISERDKPGVNREGTQSSFSLSKPLFALASTWGVGVSFSHRYAIDRRFRGLNLLPVDCSTGQCLFPVNGNGRFLSQLDIARGAVEDASLIGVQYEMRRWDVTTSGVRQWGTDIKHQVNVGYSVDNTDPRPLASFPGNAIEREAFIRDVLPRNEVTSTPFVSYGFFIPKFKTFRNISTFELAEDARLGAAFDVSYSVGLKLLGSDFNFQRGSIGGSWGFPWCRDGLVRPSASISTRLQNIAGDGEGAKFIDNTASLGIRVVTPTYKWARLVAEGTIATRWNDIGNRFFAIGSDNGLRGFLINEFSGARTGDRLIRTQFELRTVPRPLWVIRYGGVLFYEVGGVGDTFAGNNKIQLHHDIGVGFRMLIPQTARDLFRFDFAMPLDGNNAGALRFIAGFESAF